MTRVFSYIRVSSKGQLEGDGFDRQRSIIREFCEKNDYSVAREFREEAVSGTVEAVDRPALGRAMEMCGGALGITTIVVERADRIARDSIINELFFREARKLGITVIEAASGTVLSTEDDSDPTKKMIRQMLGVLAEWEKSMLVKKLRMARERIRQSGKRCEGARPRPIPEVLQPLWSEMQNRYHIQEKSLNQICRWLTTQTKTHWPRSTVHSWLTSPHNYHERKHALTVDATENELR